MTEKVMDGTVRRMVEEDLPRVLEWRNHLEVRRFMYTQHEISPDEHRGWFANANRDSARHLLIFEVGDVPLGFVNFHAPGAGKVADWGFYLAPEAPRGTGRSLGRVALSRGFDEFGFHKVCGEALAFNVRSTRFHLSLGFQQEGVLRDQHFDGQAYHAVVRFGLLQNEWNASDRE